MSIINFAKNKFFDDDDYAYNAVANARRSLFQLICSVTCSENVNPDTFPLNIDLIQVCHVVSSYNQTPDMYVIIADVPGVPKDRVNVQVKDNKILIEGKRKKKVISDDDTYLVSGRRNGFFKKMIQMPMDADSQDMVAKLEDGMLILTVPRVKKIDGATYVSIA